jgi:hypothetical protein
MTLAKPKVQANSTQVHIRPGQRAVDIPQLGPAVLHLAEIAPRHLQLVHVLRYAKPETDLSCPRATPTDDNVHSFRISDSLRPLHVHFRPQQARQ